ncbi:MAG TPA: response regulator, partial [Thermodesulfobacteriota bacterium]|nr:response regulator [Thermodesulfobacteriota bacterium]
MEYDVLIVDDSQTMRKVIRKSVALCGFPLKECLEAGNGREALALLKTRRVDLILTDLNMPDMDGLEMVQTLREDAGTRDTPVVMITTLANEDVKDAAFTLGVKGFLQKPFLPEALREVLHRAV